jgi:hypothetical protein
MLPDLRYDRLRSSFFQPDLFLVGFNERSCGFLQPGFDLSAVRHPGSATSSPLLVLLSSTAVTTIELRVQFGCPAIHLAQDLLCFRASSSMSQFDQHDNLMSNPRWP